MWGELSSECWASCLWASSLWGELSWGELSLGRVVLIPMICGSFKYDIGRLIGGSLADHRPIAKTPKLSADGK